MTKPNQGIHDSLVNQLRHFDKPSEKVDVLNKQLLNWRSILEQTKVDLSVAKQKASEAVANSLITGGKQQGPSAEIHRAQAEYDGAAALVETAEAILAQLKVEHSVEIFEALKTQTGIILKEQSDREREAMAMQVVSVRILEQSMEENNIRVIARDSYLNLRSLIFSAILPELTLTLQAIIKTTTDLMASEFGNAPQHMLHGIAAGRLGLKGTYSNPLPAFPIDEAVWKTIYSRSDIILKELGHGE